MCGLMVKGRPGRRAGSSGAMRDPLVGADKGDLHLLLYCLLAANERLNNNRRVGIPLVSGISKEGGDINSRRGRDEMDRSQAMRCKRQDGIPFRRPQSGPATFEACKRPCRCGSVIEHATTNADKESLCWDYITADRRRVALCWPREAPVGIELCSRITDLELLSSMIIGLRRNY